MKIPQGRHRPLEIAAEVLRIYFCTAAVNQGFFLGGELPGAHELLTKRQKKLGFQHYGVLAIPVSGFHVHCIDVVGAGSGDMDHLAAQAMDKGMVLPLRVDDYDIVICG